MEKMRWSWGVIAGLVSFWLASIYNSRTIHEFFANGYSVYGFEGQWPPDSVGQFISVIVLGIFWLIQTAFIACLVAIPVSLVGIPLVVVGSAVVNEWQTRRNRHRKTRT